MYYYKVRKTPRYIRVLIMGVKEGFRVSGIDALLMAKTADAAMKTKFNLGIIDVRMPGLSGTETYMRLKNILPDMEAIFFTAARCVLRRGKRN